jgi:hypothetical protein
MPTGATRHRPVSLLGATSDTKMTLDKGLEMKKSDCPGLGGATFSALEVVPLVLIGLLQRWVSVQYGYWYGASSS